MKNLFIKYFFILYSILLVSGCTSSETFGKPEDNDKECKVEFTSAVPVFDNISSIKEVEIVATGKWTAESDQPWCSITPKSGSKGYHTLEILVEKNETEFERNASISVETKDMKDKMTISQKERDAFLLSSSKAEISSEKQSVRVEVKTNIGYTYAIDDKARSWITDSKSRSLSSHSLEFFVAKNESNSARQGNIIFESGQHKEVFTIYQQPGHEDQLVLSEKEFVVSSKQNDIKIELQSNTDYKMLLPEVDWIHEQPTRAMSSYTHYLTISENESAEERTADILFLYGEKTESVHVYQKSKDAIIVAKKFYTINVEGGDLYFSVASNVSFETTCNVNWIKAVNPSRDINLKEMHFEVQANPFDEKRQGEILFKSENEEQKVVILQNGRATDGLSILNSLKAFDWKSGCQDLYIEANSDWSVKSLESWCKVEPSHGQPGNQRIRISVEENPNHDERNAGIVFYYGQNKKIITVVQKQKDALILESSKAELGAKGGTVCFEIKTNMNCSVEVDENAAEWVTPIPSRALRSERYQFQVAENNNSTKREAKIYIKGNGLEEVYRIYQEGYQNPGIVASVWKYSFDYNQFDFEIEVKSNIEYNIIMPKVDWLHENRSRSFSTYTHKFSIDENMSDKERSTIICFSSAEVTDTVWIYQEMKEVSPQCNIKVTFSNMKQTVPLLSGNKEVSGIISWDGTNLPYKSKLTHIFNYSESNQQSYNIKAENANLIHFDDIKEIDGIQINTLPSTN